MPLHRSAAERLSMYKVLIVDDEKIARDSISFIVEKEFSGNIQIHTARNGMEAIDRACEERPDLLLMDIKMPGISGLDAAEEIFSVLPDSVILFISAHEDFDFARKALRLGAVDYVNKPVNRSELIAVLKNTMTRIDRMKSDRQNNLKMRNDFFLTRPLLEQNLIYGIILAPGGPGPDLLELDEFRSILSEGGRIITVQYRDPGLKGCESLLFPDELRRSLVNQMKIRLDCLVGPAILDRFSLLVPGKPELNSREEQLLVERNINELWVSLSERERDVIRIGIGGYADTDHFHDSYDQSLSALGAEVESPGFFTVPEGSLPGNHPIPEILGGSEETALILAEQLLCSGLHMDNLKTSIFEEAARLVHSFRVKNHLSEPWLVSGAYLRDINVIETFRELCSWLHLFMSSLSRCREAIPDDSDFIGTARKIIEESFTDIDLSLESVADRCGVNPAYLSSRFREATGTNFMHFLTNLRLDHACRLLNDRNLTVKEISYMTGYRDPNYFSRLFRARLKLSPSEYRNQKRGELV